MMKRMMMVVLACAGVGMVEAGPLTEKIAAKYKVKSADTWYGGQRTVFDFQGYDAWVVEPPANVTPKAGKPWTWTMQWRTAFVPRTSVPRLLQMGWYHVSVDTFARRMDSEGLKVSAAFQKFLVEDLGFAPKACLIGMSWGGFFSTRYMATYPENVSKVYLDCPLLNFSGYTDPGKVSEWDKTVPPDNNWMDDPRMPVNMAEKIAKTGIPILLIYGGHDQILMPRLNSELFLARYKKAGGKPQVIYRYAYGHHPHGVEVDEDTIIKFFGAK